MIEFKENCKSYHVDFPDLSGYAKQKQVFIQEQFSKCQWFWNDYKVKGLVSVLRTNKKTRSSIS